MLPHHPHYQLWQDSFSNVGLYTGAPYPGCTQQDLIDYQHDFSDPNSYPVHFMDQNPFKFISKAAAAKLATNFLRINRQPTPEVNRLFVVKLFESWGPDTTIKALPDLDVAFFGGNLRNNVGVFWKTGDAVKEDPEFKGCWAEAFFKARGHCNSYLNRDMMFNRQWPDIMARETTLHELVHAYEHVLCGNCLDQFDMARDHGSGHGWFFKYAISLVDSHSRHHLWFGATAPDEEKRYRVDLDWAAENFPLGLEGGDSAESSSTQ